MVVVLPRKRNVKVAEAW